MAGMKHNPILHVCYSNEIELEEFQVEETLLQVCSTDKNESKSIIVNESSTEENNSECVHKNTNEEKDAKSET